MGPMTRELPGELDPGQAVELVRDVTATACQTINTFSEEVFRTRGGRMGSGMGTLLEALWGYHVNKILAEMEEGPPPCELAWIVGQQYSDFACILRDRAWNPETLEGELFRIEAKSMNVAADESKGHFDEIEENIGDWDHLLVLIWAWEPLDRVRVFPRVLDHFFGPARPVARLRDQLHLARGGSFVHRDSCPDQCEPSSCSHHGEPLNADGKRERKSGPASCRVSREVSYAANFGGLVRMLKTNSEAARGRFRDLRVGDEVAHEYISFIHRCFPNEERNQYRVREWRSVASELGIDTAGLSLDNLARAVREAAPNYQELLRSVVEMGE